MRRPIATSIVFGIVGLLTAYGQGLSQDHSSDKAVHETLTHAKNAAGGGGSNTTMMFHGGPVILGTVNVYYIWYGNWSGNNATSILTDLAANIGGSPYFNI